jgi:hypothetical protein
LKIQRVSIRSELELRNANVFRYSGKLTSKTGGSSGRAVCGRSPAKMLVSNPIGSWMFVCCECCVMSGRGLCDELITRPEESYRLWCVVMCDPRNFVNEEALAHWGGGGCCAQNKQTNLQDTLRTPVPTREAAGAGRVIGSG